MAGGEAGASADIVPSRLWHESCFRNERANSECLTSWILLGINRRAAGMEELKALTETAKQNQVQSPALPQLFIESNYRTALNGKLAVEEFQRSWVY